MWVPCSKPKTRKITKTTPGIAAPTLGPFKATSSLGMPGTTSAVAAATGAVVTFAAIFRGLVITTSTIYVGVVVINLVRGLDYTVSELETLQDILRSLDVIRENLRTVCLVGNNAIRSIELLNPEYLTSPRGEPLRETLNQAGRLFESVEELEARVRQAAFTHYTNNR